MCPYFSPPLNATKTLVWNSWFSRQLQTTSSDGTNAAKWSWKLTILLLILWFGIPSILDGQVWPSHHTWAKPSSAVPMNGWILGNLAAKFRATSQREALREPRKRQASNFAARSAAKMSDIFAARSAAQPCSQVQQICSHNVQRESACFIDN